MSTALDRLLDLLRLEDLGGGKYRGQSQDLGWGRVFGGQVLGQAVTAAAATIEGRVLHSLHAYFVRPGDPARPIEYEVERVRDGGSFSVRRVVAHQAGHPIFNLSSSFQIPEDGFEHQIGMPPDIPGPDGLASEQELARRHADRLPEKLLVQFLRDRPVEIRMVDPVDPFRPEPREARRHAWLRAAGTMPDDPVTHQCLLAYASDWGLLTTSLQPHGVGLLTKHMQTASLDHSMWFHRPFRMDDWLLYATDSPSASGGRGLSRGSIFSRDGRLVASTAQEGLIRLKHPEGA